MVIYNYAPISVKPEGRGGGSGGRANHGNLTVAYIPRVGILIGHHVFDLSLVYRRREVNHLFLLILTILFCPGVGILIILLRKCQNPSGLTLLGALFQESEIDSPKF